MKLFVLKHYNSVQVSADSSCIFAQDVAPINTVDKECCFLGEIGKRAIVTPDQSLYDNVIDLT